MIAHFPILLIQIIALVFWYLLWFYWNRLSTTIRLLSMSVCLACALIFAFQLPAYYWPHGMVIHEKARLLLGPDSGYPERATLPMSEKVVVEQIKDGWYYVSSSYGKGWIESAHVALEDN